VQGILPPFSLTRRILPLQAGGEPVVLTGHLSISLPASRACTAEGTKEKTLCQVNHLRRGFS